MLRSSLAEIIAEQTDLSCPCAFPSFEALDAALQVRQPPEVVLMDLGLPGKSGIEAIELLRTRSKSTKVVVLTIHAEDQKVFDAICAGATGYLLKPSSAERVIEAIHQALDGAAPINAYIARKVVEAFSRVAPQRRSASGRARLTDRELEILRLLVDGLTMKKVALKLNLSYHTVDKHIRNIYAKLHVNSRAKAVATAIQEDLV